MANEQLKDLYNRYLSNDLSREELNEFLTMLHNPGDEQEVSEMMDMTWQQMFDKVVAKEKAKLVRMRIGWRRIAVAASILFVVGLATYFVISKKPEKSQPAVAKTQDVSAPATNHATITTASGRKIYLDSAANGELATEGGINVKKVGDGKVVYEIASSQAPGNSEMQYNTLTNPRGSKVIDMTLADGSHVWLNAGSSVTYPVAFVGNERKVSITGEAYFEVIHDASKPFYVSNGEMQVQVLGTHFNVNSYNDEDEMKITLLEGSVKVEWTADHKPVTKLTPGQQAVVLPSKEGSIHVNQNVDLDEVMAWKNGRFNFNGNSVESVMRQIERWYDVYIEYSGEKPDVHFMGEISRMGNVSEVLKMLEQTKAVKFKIEGRKITVSK